ncbi:tetratricopeptide repeat protein [uncultured Maribacter sp.]|uniref:tetratricopeptide repeat protein n=1 Tax=uncultured Maribacter sp. TaxID=431308 RepID=UPI00262D945F|nr:tetratricopeptide repeat protein [uncultured Maribacter sp.]
MKKYVLFTIFLLGYIGFSQEEDKEKIKALEASNNYTWDANKNLSEDKFVDAEVDYRKAISKSSENAAAPYNLGNAYYKKETYSEAFGRFKQAGEIATSKADKHKAYHNMGNVFMKRKEYEKAVEAYKEALRNNPKDEETRYNLALAKEMLKKQQDEQKNDENKDNKDQDKKDQDKNDKKDKNEDKKDGDEGDKGDKDKDQEDKKEEGDQGDKGEDKKEDNKEGDGDEKKEEKKQPNQGDQQQKQQPRPNQLSKQQVQNLLEAMQNEEKKVKDKIDAKKVKGVKVKNEKDW